jgi:hypothetical protein
MTCIQVNHPTLQKLGRDNETVQRYLFQHKIHKFILSLFATQEIWRKFIGVGHGLPQDSTPYDKDKQEFCRKFIGP